MGDLPDELSQTEKEKVEKAMVNAFLLINNFIAEIRAGRGPLSHKCLIGRPCSHAWGMKALGLPNPSPNPDPNSPPPCLVLLPRVALGRARRASPESCATRGLTPHAPRPRAEHVPRVASRPTRHPRGEAHVPRMALTPAHPGSCATRGMHAARAAPLPDRRATRGCEGLGPAYPQPQPWPQPQPYSETGTRLSWALWRTARD